MKLQDTIPARFIFWDSPRESTTAKNMFHFLFIIAHEYRTYITHYLIIARSRRGPVLYVVRLCHALVSRMDLKCNPDFS